MKKVGDRKRAGPDRSVLIKVLTPVVLVSIFIVFYGLSLTDNGQGEMVDTASQTTLPEAGQQKEPQRLQVSLNDDPVKGSGNAPVTIIEFGDFQCPFCARFFFDTLPSIQSEYIDTGKVRLVYRDFPISNHQYAQKAAEAAECADEQGMFWEYHDKLFENQEQLSTENFKKWASELGIDSIQFDECLDSGRMAGEVQSDLKEGRSYGVRGTPTFFINGIVLNGAYPFETFRQIIEQELTK